MNAIILDSSSGRWNEIVDRLGGGVYFTSGYHAAHEEPEAKAEAFVFESGDEVLFYPYLKRRIERVADDVIAPVLYDVETAHGYTGPLASTERREFLDLGWEKFSRHCRSSGVVAEFARFNPFLKNWSVAAPQMSIDYDRKTVAVDLSGGEGGLWARYSASQRNMIRKATGRGLEARQVALSDGLKSFVPLYEATMRRVGAGESYLYPDSYYTRLAGALRDRLACIAVFQGDKVVACGLFLLEATIIHYHLGGSDHEALESAPNNLLLHAAALDGIRAGCRWLHLGGGRTNKPDDSLLLFKQSFSKHRLDFMIGRAVHDQVNYRSLCDRWKNANHADQAKPYFLLYRL